MSETPPIFLSSLLLLREFLLEPPKLKPEPEDDTNRVGLFWVALSTLTTFLRLVLMTSELPVIVDVEAVEESAAADLIIGNKPKVLVEESAYFGGGGDSWVGIC